LKRLEERIRKLEKVSGHHKIGVGAGRSLSDDDRRALLDALKRLFLLQREEDYKVGEAERLPDDDPLFLRWLAKEERRRLDHKDAAGN